MVVLAKETGVSAIIASDMAVIDFAKLNGLKVHLSTQCNITNFEAVKYYSQFADVIVTARELSLEQVKNIVCKIKEENIKGPSGDFVKIEIFVHGALCMAVSGKCYISLDNFNFSANRGACLQACRRAYMVKDYDNELELAIENKYIMSPKDLCTISFLDKIINVGVSVFKIEGRGRSADYVKTVTACYRQATDAILANKYSQELANSLQEKLKNVFNRGFWDGYYLGRKVGQWTENYGSLAKQKKLYVGKITNYFSNIQVAEIKIESDFIAVNDNVLIIGPTSGVVELTVQEIRVDLQPVTEAKKGCFCSIKVENIVRRGDKVYRLIICD